METGALDGIPYRIFFAYVTTVYRVQDTERRNERLNCGKHGLEGFVTSFDARTWNVIVGSDAPITMPDEIITRFIL